MKSNEINLTLTKDEIRIITLLLEMDNDNIDKYVESSVLSVHKSRFLEIKKENFSLLKKLNEAINCKAVDIKIR